MESIGRVSRVMESINRLTREIGLHLFLSFAFVSALGGVWKMIINPDDVVLATFYTLLAGVLGFAFMLVAAVMLPKLINRLTPNIDEEKEMIRGNMAVATYFGQVVQACIVGMSIIIAAALIAGIHG